MLYPAEVDEVIRLLKASKSQPKSLRDTRDMLVERAADDELEKAYAEAALGKGEEEDDYDGDEAAVSRSEDRGAYVAVWKWVRNTDLPEEIQKKFNLKEEDAGN
jgi:hypothetical protein